MNKKIIVIILIGVLSNTFMYAKTSKINIQFKNKERKFVERFLDDMIKNEDFKAKCLLKYISPKYIEENNIDTANVSINYYGLVDYEYVGKAENIIKYKIFGKNYKWQHDLTFRVDKIDNEYYLVPGKYENNVICPWREVSNSKITK